MCDSSVVARAICLYQSAEFLLQCLVLLHQWLSRPAPDDDNSTAAADQLRHALRAIGRDDVVAQCMTGRQQVPGDADDGDDQRQDAISALVHRTYVIHSLNCERGSTLDAELIVIIIIAMTMFMVPSS